MKSLFAGLVAVILAVSFGGHLLAQAPAQAPAKVQAAVDPATKAAIEARSKQLEAVAKGDRRAVEADAKLKTDTAALAPTLVTQAGIGCTVTDSLNRASWPNNIIVELACQEGVGYLVAAAPNGANAQAQECLASPNRPLPAPCVLPANANPVKALQAYVNTKQPDCTVEKAQLLGGNAKLSAYEVACSSGVGALLTVGLPRSPTSPVVMVPCLAITSLLPGDVKCTLTTEEANFAPVKALAAKSDKACPLKDARYVTSTADATIYEYACEDGTGFMLQASEKGAIQRTLTCVEAAGVGGGCLLTDASAALAGQNTAYATLVKAAGFDCAVSKFNPFQPKDGATYQEAVEVGCDNRPESAVALITNGKAEMLNCVRARAEGFTCAYSKNENAYKLLTENLRQAGRVTCEVSGARVMGTTASGRAFVEVACADGNPGFVISYPKAAGKPSEAVACGQASSLGGGCQMPANKKS